MPKNHDHTPGYTNSTETIIRCKRCLIQIQPVICPTCEGSGKIYSQPNWTTCPHCSKGIQAYEPIDDQPMMDKWDSAP